MGIHFAGKHATKFKGVDFLFVFREIGHHFVDGCGVIFLDRKIQQFAGVSETCTQRIESRYNLFQSCSFLPQRLRPFRVVPYVRLFELALDLGQPFRLGLVVKGTSSTRQCVR